VSTLYLFCGLPGSGKSTVARIVADDEGAVRLAPDDWLDALGFDGHDSDARERIERLQWEHGQELLRQGLSVILEFGFWARAERDQKRDRARELGVSVELWFLDDDLEVLWSRVERRNTTGAGAGPVWPVAREDFLLWAEQFEAPDAEELALYDGGGDEADDT
jgi:predicted kinase